MLGSLVKLVEGNCLICNAIWYTSESDDIGGL
jgi:hypothetical protein